MQALGNRPRRPRRRSPAAGSRRLDAGAVPPGLVGRRSDGAPQGAEGRESGGQLGRPPLSRDLTRPGGHEEGSARLGSARLGSARLGSARLGSARLLIILFSASSYSSAFKNIALLLHDCRRGGRRAGPEPYKRCRVGSSEAAEPLGQDEGAKNARAGDPRSGSGHSRPNGRWFESHGAKPIGWGSGRSRGARATGSAATPARSTRSESGFRISDVSVPSLPSRSRIPVHCQFDPIFWSQMSNYGRWTQRLRLSDGQRRIERFRGAEERSDGPGRTPPDAGQRPGGGRPGRLPAGKPSPRCMRRRRTGSRARYGGCSPMIGRTATTARVRRRSGRSDTKERRRAERLRKARRGEMANRSDRDRPDPNPITHEAQLGAAVFPGARGSCPRGSGCAFAPKRAGSPCSREVALSKSPWSRPERCT